MPSTRLLAFTLSWDARKLGDTYRRLHQASRDNLLMKSRDYLRPKARSNIKITFTTRCEREARTRMQNVNGGAS